MNLLKIFNCMILFHFQDTCFQLISKRIVKHWICEVISSFGYKAGNINFIFSDDNGILEINRKFLNHDFYTDVITFDTSDYSSAPVHSAASAQSIDGDIFISVDTVYANAIQYSADFSEELYRVMIHGVLHLVGYDDIADEDRKDMKCAEEFSLSMFRHFAGVLPMQKYC